jgi:hypothetical protein
VDPVAGPSTWRRAVLDGEQVLVCPDCQAGDWAAAVDRCEVCGSTRLSKKLGVITCGACGSAASPSPGATSDAGSRGTDPGLAAEIAAAVDRVLGRD